MAGRPEYRQQRSRLTMKNDLDLRRGYYLAVANLVRLHDLPGVAAELLAEYGPVDLKGIDAYDAAELRKLVKDEPRHFGKVRARP